MKWIALGFLFVGLLAIISAAAMNKTSSFEDGSFLGEMSLYMLGGGCLVIATVLFAVMLFYSL